MAKNVFISPCYLSTLFKNETNMSYKNYVIDVKIKKAKEMLINTDTPVYKIVSNIGYRSPQHFSNLFQKKTGLLPNEYRAKYKSK